MPDAQDSASVDSRDGSLKNEKEKKSRRPANTAFRQQRLKAWQPILTPKTVLPLFFLIGIVFAPIGGVLLYASAQVQSIRIDYTKCATDAPLTNDTDSMAIMPSNLIHTSFKGSNLKTEARWSRMGNLSYTYDRGVTQNDTVQCRIQFNVPENFGSPVLFYYYLTNFYQNHRRYVASFNADQLKGHAVSYSTIKDSKCDPLRHDDENRPYYPCGLIANSMFNDTFTSPRNLNTNESYVMKNNSDIAWNSDKELYGPTKYNYSEISPPPNWRKLYPDGYTAEHQPPDLKNWEAFQVWMRTAGLPDFTKLYQRNDDDTLVSGTYEVIINDNFPSRAYKGSKSFLITTHTVMGGKNPFLGIAYVVVGGLCIILGVVFTITHLIHPRKLGDHTYLSWNNTPASGAAGAKSGGISSGSAVASGRDMRPGEA
ncbi:Meiotically up-regulated protein 89 [Ceratocystis platani]|uniref:Meiotically up-regulated protein 89 n=1 Tax=Ceratocystis fimbriata f. sp. platani TaxID=88771 RepID=A0A0F8DIW0_CERFI|nr:Meiotically up-regulated protein 89 [Ceratocystis platani]